MGIERPVDFSKHRILLCKNCKYRAAFPHSWIDLWEQGKETCPSCRIESSHQRRAVYDWDHSDLITDISKVLNLNWYHTTTHTNWPDPHFDPAEKLTSNAKNYMRNSTGNPHAVEEWVARQKTKALHVGTYEAAIENMLRQLGNQRASETQYYLYRVKLSKASKVAPGVNPEPSSSFGDSYLADLGIESGGIYRYINVHEDEGSVSLALGTKAIEAVQRIAIPLLPHKSSESQLIKNKLDHAEFMKPEPKNDKFSKIRSKPLFTNPYLDTTQLVWREIATSIPDRLQDKFSMALDTRIQTAGNEYFSRYMLGMRDLILNPEWVLKALDDVPFQKREEQDCSHAETYLLD